MRTVDGRTHRYEEIVPDAHMVLEHVHGLLLRFIPEPVSTLRDEHLHIDAYEAQRQHVGLADAEAGTVTTGTVWQAKYADNVRLFYPCRSRME